MSYRIERIELYVRETPPGRMVFSLGKAGGTGDSRQALLNPLGHVRLVLRDSAGNTTFGCSGDRLSVRWLDKRPGRAQGLKRRELVDLLHQARDVYLAKPEFESPFEKWRQSHPEIMRAGRAAGQEDLTSSFASAQMERAMLDAVCRLHGKSIFQMVKENRLGFEPASVHPEIGDLDFPSIVPIQPATRFSIRHTVGLADPLKASEVPDEKRIDDGLPETLEEYIRADGIRHFKVKISGDPEADLERLARIWDVILRADQPAVTLDANEAYGDLKVFADFVRRFENDLTGLFQHVLYIEQPLPRSVTLDRTTEHLIREIAERKPLLIDEADGTVDAYKRAHAIGYQGTSHKNCKGFFKSLLNHALVVHYARNGDDSFLSAEDLQNLPIVPLHQDFATLGILGLEHCERNGHHYNYGLSMLSAKDKASIARRHPDLYERRGDEYFLKIRDGAVECGSLQCPGFGVFDEPDWSSMQPMKAWVQLRHPA